MFTSIQEFPLPPFLLGIVSLVGYNLWLDEKAMTLLSRDRERNRPCALSATRELYRERIHAAVMKNGTIDPFTGDRLRWDLVRKWDPSKNIGHKNFIKKFCLLPTVDHIDPYSADLEFEICSWLINDCKSDQTPEEFIAMCRMIMEYRRRKPAGKYAIKIRSLSNVEAHPLPGDHKLYFLPDFLTGICIEEDYRKWLIKRARELYLRDLAQGRPYAVNGSQAEYKKLIHAAVISAGLIDPYTGETMRYELIGTWDTSKDQPDDYNRKFYLLPTVDHVDPYTDVLELGICSRRINSCKSSLTPDEFVGVCRSVAERFPA